MGFWSQDTEGHSFAEDSVRDLLWGDGPADIFDAAIAAVDEEFEERFGRKASREELRAGLLFSLGGDDDRPEYAPRKKVSA